MLEECVCHQRLTELFRMRDRIACANPRKDDRIFVAAVARDHVAGPHLRLRQHADRAQHVIAFVVSEVLVECRKVIEIAQRDRHRLPRPGRGFKRPGKCRAESCARGQCGRRIGLRLRAHMG